MRTLVLLALAASVAAAQERRADPLPVPDVKDEAYGPHARNVLDLWKPKADAPTPVLVYIHGGGFRTGSKAQLNPGLLRRCLENGIAVAAINYRLTDTAPFPAPMHDGGRAVQFLRHRAKDWNLDPARVACSGGSAGAGISLWLAFHDDLANPKSEDPVARQSTRLRGALVHQAQCSYDPRFIQEHVGGRAHEHAALPPFWGLRRDELTGERADRIFKACSPITHLSADDPPVYCSYTGRDLPDPERPGAGIHHENFGKVLKAGMEKLALACTVKVGRENRDTDETAFLVKILK